jgi:hypothetical protein
MIELQRTFKLKGDKMKRPETYLGAQLDTMTIDDVECWIMSTEKYVKSAVDNVETTTRRLPSKCHTPFSSNYKPELDMTAELKADGVQYYQDLVGVLQWAVEIGRVDILLETSLMSSHLALPDIGHLEQLYHMFGYLKIYPKCKLAFDPTHPKIDERRFVKHDRTDHFYQDVKEGIPSDMPPPRGKSVSAGNMVTRCSQTGVLVLFVNHAPIIWYSKRQNTAETSTFGSEFTAQRTLVELVVSLHYKLRMFGIPIKGPTNVFCDKEAVYKNALAPA